MKVKLLANLGHEDATKAGLEPGEPTEGTTVNLSSKVAQEFIKRGIAEDPSGKPAGAEDEEEDFDAMTKEELKSYADEHHIPGVTMALAKDDMLKTVKRHARKGG